MACCTLHKIHIADQNFEWICTSANLNRYLCFSTSFTLICRPMWLWCSEFKNADDCAWNVQKLLRMLLILFQFELFLPLSLSLARSLAIAQIIIKWSFQANGLIALKTWCQHFNNDFNMANAQNSHWFWIACVGLRLEIWFHLHFIPCDCNGWVIVCVRVVSLAQLIR